MISSDMPVPSCIICGCSGKNSMSHYEEEGEGSIIFQSSHRMMMLESLHLQGKPLHMLRESLGHLRVLRETNGELKVAMEGSLSHVVNNNTGDASRRSGTMLMKASIAKTYRRNKDQRAVVDACKCVQRDNIQSICESHRCYLIVLIHLSVFSKEEDAQRYTCHPNSLPVLGRQQGSRDAVSPRAK